MESENSKDTTDKITITQQNANLNEPEHQVNQENQRNQRNLEIKL